MKNQLVEYQPQEYGLEESTAVELTQGLDIPKQERIPLIQEFDRVSKLEVTQEKLKEFRELRLKIQKNRTQGFNKWHSNAKEFFLRGGQFVDAIRRKEIQINKDMERVLMQGEKHFELLEQKRLDDLQDERASLLSKYVEDASERNLSQMEEDVWDAYLQAKVNEYNARIEAERKAEAERIAKEKAEAKEPERIRKENEQLKAEAIERERLAKIEADKRAIAEAERLEKERKEREVYEAKLKAEKLERERIQKEEEAKRKKLEDEIQARKDLELKAKQEAERLAKEELKRLEELKKAPIKKQLQEWINELEITEAPIKNDVSIDIAKRFDSFKKWANNQINNL